MNFINMKFFNYGDSEETLTFRVLNGSGKSDQSNPSATTVVPRGVSILKRIAYSKGNSTISVETDKGVLHITFVYELKNPNQDADMSFRVTGGCISGPTSTSITVTKYLDRTSKCT